MSDLKRIDVEAVFRKHPFAKDILLRLEKAGHDAVLIGGVVRDGLERQLGRDVDFPSQDIDIATSALPDEIRELFPQRPIIGVGEEFGVLLIVAPDGRKYEVASFRVESEYDGRWPGKVDLVRDLSADVRRRDLTINGLAATARGEVIDLVGGVNDLVSQRIITIGDPAERFGEDYLRMMRAVRFACRIDGTVDSTVTRAIEALSSSITRISPERIGEELLRILATPRAARGLELLDDFGLLEQILPETHACHDVAQPEEFHPEGDVFVHTLAALRVADGFVRDPVVKLAVLLHDIGKPIALARNEGRNMGGHCAIGARMAKQVGRRLRLSNTQSQRLSYLVQHHMRIADFPVMGRGKQVRFVSEGEIAELPAGAQRYPLFFDLLQLVIADCEASVHRSSGWAPILRETIRVMDHIEHVCGLQRARELIDGHDLIRMGLRPSSHLGGILDDLHDRILAGHITTHTQALACAKKLIDDAEQRPT